MTTKSVKVFWKPAEKELVARELIRLRGLNPGTNLTPLINLACDVLPADRRRKIQHWSSEKWLAEVVPAMEAKMAMEAAEAKAESDARVQAVLEAEAAEAAAKVEAMKQKAVQLKGFSLEELMAEVSRRCDTLMNMVEGVKKAAEDVEKEVKLGDTLPANGSGIEAKVTSVAYRKPNVLIIGGNREQFQTIKKEFSYLNLTHFNPEYGSKMTQSQLDTLAGRSEAVFHFTQFSKHCWTENIKKQSNYVRVTKNAKSVLPVIRSKFPKPEHAQ